MIGRMTLGLALCLSSLALGCRTEPLAGGDEAQPEDLASTPPLDMSVPPADMRCLGGSELGCALRELFADDVCFDDHGCGGYGIRCQHGLCCSGTLDPCTCKCTCAGVDCLPNGGIFLCCDGTSDLGPVERPGPDPGKLMCRPYEECWPRPWPP